MDLFFFLVLDLGDPYTTSIPVGYRILDGLFQVYHCVRDADFRRYQREQLELQ